MRYAIFGDTGGHAKQLFASLRSLGVNLDDFSIPEDLTIIHLGDLIHKGPSSSHLLEVVDALIRNPANQNRWVQILGNHEFQHIHGAPYFWKCDCENGDLLILNKWFREGLATATFGLDNIAKPDLEISARKTMSPSTSSFLFSHAGLSYHWWKKIGRPLTAIEASEKLNSLSVKEITLPGQMLGLVGYQPGPVWAIGNSEVFNSWVDSDETSPFSQVHGHTTSFRWNQGVWWDKSKNFKRFREASKVNTETRAVLTNMAGNLLIGIDPGYNKTADTAKQPYVSLESSSWA